MAHYIIEALMVGLMTAVIMFIISTALMYIQDSTFSLKKYAFWPWVLLGGFLTGILVHLICQWTGINKWYCKHGDACRK